MSIMKIEDNSKYYEMVEEPKLLAEFREWNESVYRHLPKCEEAL